MRSPHAIAREIGDEIVIVDSLTKQAHALSGLVAQVWRASATGTWIGPTDNDFHAALDQLLVAGLLVEAPGISRRSMLARSGLVAAGVGIVSVGLPETIAAASNQSITRAPTTGPVGTTVSVSGLSFPGGQLVTITFDGVTMTTTPAAPTTTAGGAFTNVKFTVPAAVAGVHTIAAIVGGQSATTTFTVTPQVFPAPAFLPRNGSNQSVTLTGTGYAANSTITITLGGDFSSATIPASITTNATGGFTATITGINYPNGSGSGSFTATDASANTASTPQINH
jgi:hypothetical protein